MFYKYEHLVILYLLLSQLISWVLLPQRCFTFREFSNWFPLRNQNICILYYLLFHIYLIIYELLSQIYFCIILYETPIHSEQVSFGVVIRIFNILMCFLNDVSCLGNNTRQLQPSVLSMQYGGNCWCPLCGGDWSSYPISTTKYIPSIPQTFSGTMCNRVHPVLLICIWCLVCSDSQ